MSANNIPETFNYFEMIPLCHEEQQRQVNGNIPNCFTGADLSPIPSTLPTANLDLQAPFFNSMVTMGDPRVQNDDLKDPQSASEGHSDHKMSKVDTENLSIFEEVFKLNQLLDMIKNESYEQISQMDIYNFEKSLTAFLNDTSNCDRRFVLSILIQEIMNINTDNIKYFLKQKQSIIEIQKIVAIHLENSLEEDLFVLGVNQKCILKDHNDIISKYVNIFGLEHRTLKIFIEKHARAKYEQFYNDAYTLMFQPNRCKELQTNSIQGEEEKFNQLFIECEMQRKVIESEIKSQKFIELYRFHEYILSELLNIKYLLNQEETLVQEKSIDLMINYTIKLIKYYQDLDDIHDTSSSKYQNTLDDVSEQYALIATILENLPKVENFSVFKLTSMLAESFRVFQNICFSVLKEMYQNEKSIDVNELEYDLLDILTKLNNISNNGPLYCSVIEVKHTNQLKEAIKFVIRCRQHEKRNRICAIIESICRVTQNQIALSKIKVDISYVASIDQITLEYIGYTAKKLGCQSFAVYKFGIDNYEALVPRFYMLKRSQFYEELLEIEPRIEVVVDNLEYREDLLNQMRALSILIEYSATYHITDTHIENLKKAYIYIINKSSDIKCKKVIMKLTGSILKIPSSISTQKFIQLKKVAVVFVTRLETYMTSEVIATTLSIEHDLVKKSLKTYHAVKSEPFVKSIFNIFYEVTQSAIIRKQVLCKLLKTKSN